MHVPGGWEGGGKWGRPRQRLILVSFGAKFVIDRINFRETDEEVFHKMSGRWC